MLKRAQLEECRNEATYKKRRAMGARNDCRRRVISRPPSRRTAAWGGGLTQSSGQLPETPYYPRRASAERGCFILFDFLPFVIYYKKALWLPNSHGGTSRRLRKVQYGYKWKPARTSGFKSRPGLKTTCGPRRLYAPSDLAPAGGLQLFVLCNRISVILSAPQHRQMVAL